MRQLVLKVLLIGFALLPSGCAPQPTILSVQSCPVYQSPETPRPEWPKACGGQR